MLNLLIKNGFSVKQLNLSSNDLSNTFIREFADLIDIFYLIKYNLIN